MNRTSTYVTVALIAFLVGVISVSAWLTFQHASSTPKIEIVSSELRSRETVVATRTAIGDCGVPLDYNERPRTVSGGVLNGKANEMPMPDYPPLIASVPPSGSVNVQVVINGCGNVESATAVSGHPLLRNSAVNAARQARFAQTRLSGMPVKVSGVLVYNFNPDK